MVDNIRLLQKKNKQWFQNKQQQLLRFLREDNQQFLKHAFNINWDLPLVKITPNALIFLTGEVVGNKPLLRGKFFCYEAVAKYIIPVIEKMEISLQEEKYVKYILENPYKSFLHFADLECQKNLPQIFLDQSNFYAGAGDGFVTYAGSGGESLTTVHDATTGTAADATGTTATTAGSRTDGTPNFRHDRAFLPVDGTPMGVGATISAIVLNIYGTAKTNTDGGGLGISQGSQASTSTLATADYDACDVGHPATRGATDLGTASFLTGQYNQITANATGRGWASVTGFFTYVVRNDGDLDGNHNGAFVTGVNSYSFSTSENTGTSQDPYLDITYRPARGAGFVFAGMM